MKKIKNAFTLIELLAVIVILAIIALIATPIILEIVEDTKKDAFMRSVELLVSTTDIDIANKTFEEEYTYEITDGNISNLEVSVKNTQGMNGTITYDLEGKEEYAIYNGVYCVTKTGDMSKAEISDYKEGECVIPTELTENDITSVTFNDLEYTYDGTEKRIEVNSLPEGFTVEYTNNTGTNAGEYRASATIKGNSQYTGSITKTATLTINKAPITIQAEDKSSDEGNTLVELTYQITSGTIYNNDDLKIELTKEEGDTAGEYDITVSAENGNYEITKVNGTYTIAVVIVDPITLKVPNENDVVTYTNGQLINLGEYGIRYQGSDPNNYVYFNCEDYSNQTEDTCETWRIIGVVDGKVKIISEEIGTMEWDASVGGTYDNNWNDSSLKTYLNGEYYASLTEATRNSNYISPSTWYLRGHNTSKVTKDTMYNLERTTGSVYGSNPPYIENTKIGIMYPSDWGYAAMENESCLATTILNSYQRCKSSNWIKQGSTSYQWFITPLSGGSSYAFIAFADGYVRDKSVCFSFGVRVVLHLSSDIELEGEGTQNTPYKLKTK